MSSLATTIEIGDQHATLDHELSYGDASLPRYTTVSEIARSTGTDRRWVTRQVRRGVVRPALTKGEWQFDRPGTLRLLLLAHLQRMFGESSNVPFTLVEAAGPSIDFLLKNPGAGTLLTLQHGGTLRLVVSVPGLKELLAAGA